jgi:dihydrolipoamide dehydrogenase
LEKIDFIVIGGGPAGYSCAKFLSLSGKRTLLIEKEEIGGVCLNRGCIPTKTILSSLRRFSGFLRGVKGGEFIANGDVLLSREEILKRKENVVRILKNGILSELQKAGVKIVKGFARFEAEKVLAVNGERLSADGIVIAVGSSPLIPPPLKKTDRIIFAEESFDRMKNPPSSICIIGGGAIGCEMAQIFSALGSKVTIVEIMEHILPFLDREIADTLRREMEKTGIKILSNKRVESFEENGNSVKLRLSGGEEITAELVLIAAGRKANTEELNLSGIETERGWIRVNENFETSMSGIYAIGDCNGISLTAYAGYLQAVVLSNLIKGEKRTYPRDFIPGGVFTNPEVAWVGLTSKEALKRGYEIGERTSLIREIGRAHADGEIGGIAKITFEKKTKKVLGLQIVSPHATEIINYLGTLLLKGMTIEDIAFTHHLHPTFSEVIWEASVREIF